ncbi:hypothetical protein Lfu02_54490 [Longispora fulva]|uniref:Uncharacterized protein n=1 Tax=Longispora fulva TaxID=619741 RepID=A0A8J7KK25_9ACTN|nr:hypothetical protein [Longispora fulva]MBG6137569.1 hypothetical protein [Longispora fulva]GIG61077.1 hypothetical protein Lfu02_54490 [Longispora fulva]
MNVEHTLRPDVPLLPTPVLLPPPAPPTLLRRFLDFGIGGFLALGVWGAVGAMGVGEVLFATFFFGPAWLVLGLLLCIGAYGFALVLCFVAVFLTIPGSTRRAAVTFLVGSALANGAFVVGALLLLAVFELAEKFGWW